MAFKSKLPPQGQTPTVTSAPTIVADAVSQSTEATPIPLLTLEDIITGALDELPPVVEDKFIEFQVPDYPKDLYNEAVIANEMRDFNTQLGNAMRPEIKTYTPPPVPPAIAEATRREMEAGRKRVAEFAAVEQQRRVVMAERKKEPWEGNTTAVFRPTAYVPDPRGVDRTGTLRVLSNG